MANPEELQDVMNLLQDKTPEGKQARQNLGMVFLFRIQTSMAEADELLATESYDGLFTAYKKYKSVFRKVYYFFTAEECKKLEELQKKCEPPLKYLRNIRNSNMISRRNFPINPFESAVALENFDLELNNCLNKHNLNMMIRKPDEKAMDEE